MIKEYDAVLPMLGDSLSAWEEFLKFINKNYEMDEVWRAGEPNKSIYNELKFRRGGKTLVSLYIREGHFISVIILGKAEREKFEQQKDNFSPKVYQIYEETKTYHDGKWLGFEVNDNEFVKDMCNLLLIKRKPNRKS
ncbi:MAG: DUF3788 domain-containing protein [Defluviitaleaceae bacterium]|nr:DUF3788 domain-containing protein [Defluviitaleaceae bacterium]